MKPLCGVARIHKPHPMKNAFLPAAIIALASAVVVTLQLLGVVSFSLSSSTLLLGGFCSGGVLTLAITDYAPRRRRRVARTSLRQIQCEKAWLRAAPAPAA